MPLPPRQKLATAAPARLVGLPMLACRQLDVLPRAGAPALVHGADADFAAGQLHALIGPSGCGKTTLLKGLLGILPARGDILLRGRRVARPEELLREVAFAPQFSIAHGKLTVAEALDAALRLYRKTHDAGRLAALLGLVGLAERADTVVEKLSGGQLRRLGLALELAAEPACLLCDEVTSGLDPRSEDQILAVLRRLVAEQQRTVLCVIHNLAKLDQFDTVTVVYEGAVVFQGSLPALLSHFGIQDALFLYDRLAEHPVAYWCERRVPSAPAHAVAEVPFDEPAAPPRPRPHGRVFSANCSRCWGAAAVSSDATARPSCSLPRSRSVSRASW